MKGRSPLWWKSGRFLAWIWVLGSLLIAGSALPFLYGQWREIEGVSAKYQAMSSYVDAHRKELDSDPGTPPTPDALSMLADKVPPDRDIPRLLMQLRDAAESAGVKLNAVHVADSREELDRLAAQAEEEGKKSGRKRKSSPKTPKIARVEPVWLDVYLTAELPELKEWFHKLHQMTRIVSVQEWEHRLKSRRGYGNARIRILVYAYRDPALKELRAKGPPEISRESKDPIRVRPKKEEKKDRSSRS